MEIKLDFKYNSYVQDIMGPMCFGLSFGPFRWVCASGKPADFIKQMKLLRLVLEEMAKNAPQRNSAANAR
jgi:urocanate hydratase